MKKILLPLLISFLVMGGQSHAMISGNGVVTPGITIGQKIANNPNNHKLCTAGFLAYKATARYVLTGSHCIVNPAQPVEARINHEWVPIGKFVTWRNVGVSNVAAIKLYDNIRIDKRIRGVEPITCVQKHITVIRYTRPRICKAGGDTGETCGSYGTVRKYGILEITGGKVSTGDMGGPVYYRSSRAGKGICALGLVFATAGFRNMYFMQEFSSFIGRHGIRLL